MIIIECGLYETCEGFNKSSNWSDQRIMEKFKKETKTK